MIVRLFKRFLLEPWKQINAESMEARYRGVPVAPEAEQPRARAGGKRKNEAAAAYAPAPGAFDYRVVVVFVLAAVVLTLQEYYGDRRDFARFVLAPPDDVAYDPAWDLKAYCWWSGWRFLGYFVLPCLAILVMPGERIRDYGLSTKDFVKHLPIYGLLFLLILPVVIAASYTKAFQHTYPFYEGAHLAWRNLLLWELLYWLQFFSLEFFFRGFLLHGTKRAIGSYAIFAMIVPYCMIHYHKPIAEVLGAIGAGVVLGTLALKTRSIWSGVLIHISVAFSMDLLALAHTTGLPKHW